MRASDAIQLAVPLLQRGREGIEAVDCEIAGADVVVRFSGPPKAVLCHASDYPATALGNRPLDHDFWLVTAGLSRQYKDGRPLDFVGHAESVSVMIDNVTGIATEFRSL